MKNRFLLAAAAIWLLVSQGASLATPPTVNLQLFPNGDGNSQVPLTAIGCPASITTGALVTTCFPNFDAAGSPFFDTQSINPTYSVSVTFTPAATPTDVLTIAGSSSKIIRIKQVAVSGIATTAGNASVFFNRNSAADGGGSSTAPTLTTWDTINPAPTATVALYSANPTTPALLGTLQTQKVSLPLVSTASAGTSNFPGSTAAGSLPDVVLRGGQQFSVNFGGQTMPAGTQLNVTIFWQETNS